MRYVIFADVHGDKDALGRLLSRHRGNPYICLGDLYWMLTPDAVIEEMTMAAIKKGVLLIEGDHEREYRSVVQGDDSPGKNVMLKLPEDALIAHSVFTNGNANEGSSPRAVGSLEEARGELRFLSRQRVSVGFLGHTHRPAAYRFDPAADTFEDLTGELASSELSAPTAPAALIVNPGCLHGEKPTYVIFDTERGKITLHPLTD